MPERGLAEAWAAFRTDWEPVLVFFHEHGFLPVRLMINYVAELSRPPEGGRARGEGDNPDATGENWRRIRAMGEGIFPEESLQNPEEFYWDNPYFAHGEPVRREGGG